MNEDILQDDRSKVSQASATVIKLPSSSTKHSDGTPDINLFELGLDDDGLSIERTRFRSWGFTDKKFSTCERLPSLEK